MGKNNVLNRPALGVAMLCLAGLSACGAGDKQPSGGTAAGGAAAAPTLHLLASRTVLNAGESLSLTWTSAGAERCSAAGAWGGTFSANGGMDLAPPAGALRYSLVCSGAGGSASASVDVLVHPAPAGPEDPVDPAPLPTVNLDAMPQDSTLGTPVTLSWSSTDAVSCAASGGWSGALAASGSAVLLPPEGVTTYRLQCTGAGGNAMDEVAVTARPVVTPELDAALAEFNRVRGLEEGCCNATQ